MADTPAWGKPSLLLVVQTLIQLQWVKEQQKTGMYYTQKILQSMILGLKLQQDDIASTELSTGCKLSSLLITELK